jgi:hypothetical protein
VQDYFTDTFFRLLLGFVLMIGLSFAVIFGADYYARTIEVPRQMAAAAAEARVPVELLGIPTVR